MTTTDIVFWVCGVASLYALRVAVLFHVNLWRRSEFYNNEIKRMREADKRRRTTQANNP